ncbi:MAG: histidine kinase [Candidatus Rokuibacteriota bacterium]|nr:MAG: histidine kinase [Candidatus Rokubacteria bacterium]
MAPARVSAARRSVKPRPGVGAASRLDLLEALLTSRDAGQCAQRALTWLQRQTGARRALCLAADTAPPRLVPVATLGIAANRVDRFSVDLEIRDHPLTQALLSSTVTLVGGNGHGASTPLGAGPVQAFPLAPLSPRDLPAGLLLVAPFPPAGVSDVRWLARVLGPRLAALMAARRVEDAENRLQRERGLLYSIINAVIDPILLTDADGRIIIANARAETLLAADDDQSEGRRQAVTLNNMLFSAALSRHAIEGASAPRHEMPLVDPVDGSDLLFELMSTPATDVREGAGIVSILRNVTDLQRATAEIEENYRKLRQTEADARAERDRLDLVIDSVADPILVTDPGGNIVMMNAPAERLFVAVDGDSEEAHRQVQANDAHFSSFVSNLFFEGDSRRRTGSIGLVDPATATSLPMEAISGKIVSEHGEVTAVVTILHDRTEELERARLFEDLKKLSAELEQKVRDATAELVRQNELLRRSHIALEQASALKSQFLANMSHEFRTPLNAILGYTSMLLKGVSGEMTAQQRRNLERIDSNSHHLLSIINDILDISRIEAGKMPLTLVEFPLPDLIREVLAEVEPLIARSRLTVTTELDDALPLVRSDRQKVKQILINLLTNALKFTPQGWVKATAAYDKRHERLAISVADSGIGISPKDQEVIFEDFRQADDSPTRQYTGAGLGLAICRRLTQMLGGELTVHSALGEGSAFTLALPRAPKDD